MLHGRPQPHAARDGTCEWIAMRRCAMRQAVCACATTCTCSARAHAVCVRVCRMDAKGARESVHPSDAHRVLPPACSGHQLRVWWWLPCVVAAGPTARVQGEPPRREATSAESPHEQGAAAQQGHVRVPHRPAGERGDLRRRLVWALLHRHGSILVDAVGAGRGQRADVYVLHPGVSVGMVSR